MKAPWTVVRSNQSILKEINPEYSLDELMLKLKLQWFGHLMQSQVIGKDPDAGKDFMQEEKGTTEDEMVGWHHDSIDMNLGKLWEMESNSETWCVAGHGVAKSQT